MESIDTWKLVSLSPLPMAALGALLVALALGVGLACWGVRREARARARWLLWGLRLVAGLCALFFLLEPGLRRLQVARVKNRVAVLVDRSASMGFPVSPGGPTRSEAVAQALDALAPQLDALKDRYAFEVSGFDPELAPVSADALRTQPPTAGRSDLFAALRAAEAGQGGGARKLSGVILLSDGADNVDLAQGLAGRPREVLASLGVPVTTVAVGKGGLIDLAIANVQVDDFAFVRNSVSADVDVHARGFKGQSVQVVLRREGQIVGTQVVTFQADDDTRPVRFTFTPDQTGRFVYTVGVPVFPGEAVAENNVKSFALKVIRDRVRVLLVAGRPTWDERFLRGLLKQDANVELISFYILRSSNESSGAVVESRELSLIPFPKEEIFKTKIDTFDLIFVLNFSNEDPQISLAPYRDSIERYVTNGGALAYLGGDRSFGEARGGSNPLDGVLPVSTAGVAELEPFSPRLSAEGQRHPITALASGAVSTEAAWAELPKVPGLNLVRAKPGATVLLEHPSATVDGKRAPLLAVQEVGRGRALALATDGAWVWAFTSHAQGAPTRAYERFWNNAMRWLVRDPDLTTLTVTADPPSVEPGRPVVIAVGARTADYQPAPGASITVELVSADDGRAVAQATATAGPDGTARVELPPPGPGAYKVVGRATRGEVSLGEASDAVAVRAVGPELSDARVNTALLEDIARATGGAFFDAPSFSLDDVPLLEPPLVEVGRSKDQPLWDRWSWLFLLVAVLGLEWGVRRRLGYV
jgi:hypothetical protein